MTFNFETALEIEYAVSMYFGTRKNLIVPNVYPMSFGIRGGYEMDMAIMSQSGYIQEVEIKTTRSDLIKNLSKDRWRYSTFGISKRMWFAMPERMNTENCVSLVPAWAGILIVNTKGKVKITREAETNKDAKKLNINQQYKLARLGAIRIWNLKEKEVIRFGNHNLNRHPPTA